MIRKTIVGMAIRSSAGNEHVVSQYDIACVNVTGAGR